MLWMSRCYKQERICVCGYSTLGINNWSQHKRSCKLAGAGVAGPSKDDIIYRLRETVDSLKQNETRYLKELREKDAQIRALIKVADRPQTVNNRFVVENVNVFGKECTTHIKDKDVLRLLQDPTNAVSQFIKLKYKRAPNGINANIRVPNKKRAIYEVVVSATDGQKEWESRPRSEVLEQLYEENSGHLEVEAEACEDTQTGARFIRHQDMVWASSNGEDSGRRYKNQLDKIHCVLQG